MKRLAIESRWDSLALHGIGAKPGGGNRSSVPSDPLDERHWEARMALDGRCSAFIRVTPGNGNLMAGHTTWGDYTSMTRVFKYYKFPLKGANQMTLQMGFSSYPGCISSTDDFYMLDSGLLVMDTSIEILDDALWQDVIDFSVSDVKTMPNFIHLQITNWLAKTPMHWVDIYSKKNSGTMNAQWMILDYNNFKKGKPVPDNVFWILETIPGKLHSADMTHRLRTHGFWGSYNRPYFQDIREATGHDGAQKSHGAFYSWNDNPRANIFADAAPGVNSMGDMRLLLNRNQYPEAKPTPNTPGHDISARFDLSQMVAFPNGGIDAKITSICNFKKLKCQAESGPAHTDVRAFTWTKPDGKPYWPGYSHIGQPDSWTFDYAGIAPGGIGGVSDCE